MPHPNRTHHWIGIFDNQRSSIAFFAVAVTLFWQVHTTFLAVCALIIVFVAWQTHSLRTKLDGPIQLSNEDMAEAMRIYAEMEAKKK